VACRGCGKPAPAHIAKAAAAAAAAAPKGPIPGSWKQPSGAWAGGAPKSKSGSPRLDELQRKVDDLTRRLEGTLAASQLGGAGAPGGKPQQQEEEAGPDLGKLQAAQVAMAEAFGKDSKGAQWLSEKIQEHKRVKLDAKPLGTQALTAQRWADKKAKALTAAEEKVASIQELLQDLQGRLEEAQEEEKQAREEKVQALEALQAVHKKALAANEAGRKEDEFAAKAGGLWDSLPAEFREAPGHAQQLEEARKVLEGIQAKAEEWAKAKAPAAGGGAEATAGAAAGSPGDGAGMAVDAGASDEQMVTQVIKACAAGGSEEEVQKRVAAILEAAQAATQDSKRRKGEPRG
jgi:chromosome segregation protein